MGSADSSTSKRDSSGPGGGGGEILATFDRPSKISSAPLASPDSPSTSLFRFRPRLLGSPFGPGAGLGLAFSTMTARTGPGANRCHLNRINRQSQNSDTHWLKVVRFIITSYHNSMTMTLKELKPHCYVQHCIHITQKNNRYCLKFHWSWNTHVNSQVTLQDWGPNQVVLSWTQTTTVAQEYKAILVGHSGPNWHQS